MTLHRRELRLRAAQDRARIAASLAPLAGPVRALDRAIGVAQWFRRRPWVAALATAGVALVLRRYGRVRAAQVVLGGWQAGRLLARFLPNSSGR
jgi:hypothetical protein